MTQQTKKRKYVSTNLTIRAITKGFRTSREREETLEERVDGGTEKDGEERSIRI
jgi:hypothetical protein